MKKYMSLLLAFSMLISACAGCFSVYADESIFDFEDYTLKTLDNDCVEIVSYNGISDSLDIPTMLNGYTVTSIGECAFIGKTQATGSFNLSEVSLPHTVKNIGNLAFAGCSYLSEVKFPEDLETIGESAFMACTNLKSVSLGKNVSSIASGAFENCVNVRSYRVEADNKYYSSEDGVLFNKDKTELLYYPAASSNKSYTVPGSVKTIKENAFYGAKLDEITIPLSVTKIEKNAFEGADIKKANIYPSEKNFKSAIVEAEGNDEILKAPLNHIHTAVTAEKNVVSATCTRKGSYDTVVSCSVCGEVISTTHHTSAMLAHKPGRAVRKNVIQPTCGKNGSHDEIVYCTVCKKQLSRKRVTDKATGKHKLKTLNAVKPTYFKTGKTKGQYCTVCKKVIVKQKTVKKLTLATPSNKKAKAKKSGFTFSWKRNKDASGYIIQYSTSRNFSKKTTKQIKVKSGKTTSKTVSKLKKKKTYYIRIRAYKTSGKQTVYSKWSGYVKVKTK